MLVGALVPCRRLPVWLQLAPTSFFFSRICSSEVHEGLPSFVLAVLDPGTSFLNINKSHYHTGRHGSSVAGGGGGVQLGAERRDGL